MIAEPKSGDSAIDLIPARVAGELEKIEIALHNDSTGAERWGQLYAAQQALLWSVSADLAAAPYEVIVQGKVQPPNKAGIPAG